MAKISDLKFDDKNFNKHTEYGMSLLEKSLRELGAGRSILLDKDNNIIAGNGIVEAAGSVGLENVKIIETTGDEIVAVKRTDMTIDSKEGREMALADNATANADLSWDEDNIKEQTEKWDFDTSDWGMNFNFDKDVEVEEDEVPEANENEPAKSKLGEVYHLGNHRLMCGDSTDADSVAILMDGQKADMVFTDPPYGVEIKGKYTGSILNDNLVGENLIKFLLKANDNIKRFCAGSYYICYEVLNRLENFSAFGKPDEVVCFNKDSASFYSAKKYNRKFELILFYENGKPLNANSETNVWDAPKSSSFNNKDENGMRFNQNGNFCVAHPTTKPLAIPSRAIKNSSRKDDSILDLFGGSGSTLIACEQLGRKCYMMELDPKYCDVIRKRYWKFVTGSEEGWEDGTSKVAR